MYKKKYIIVFESYNSAFYFLYRINNKKYNLKIEETPTNLSSSCTKSIRFEESLWNNVYKELKNLNYHIRGIYKILDEPPYYYKIKF